MTRIKKTPGEDVGRTPHLVSLRLPAGGGRRQVDIGGAAAFYHLGVGGGELTGEGEIPGAKKRAR